MFLSTCLSRLRQHPGQLSSHRKARRSRSICHLKHSKHLHREKNKGGRLNWMGPYRQIAILGPESLKKN